MAEVAVGSVLANRYRLDAFLGQGGMGSVWRATHLALSSPVAIKLIDPRIASSQNGIERFVREARAAATLRSPHVVQTLDYGVHEGIPYIAMELLEGETLADRLRRTGRLSPNDTATVLTHIGRAIGKAHEAGIVHRDLKPDNIFLVRNDDEEIAKVLDFGIAKLMHNSQGPVTYQTETGAVVGTPYYMSPEQAGGTRSIDSRTDIWAMGVIAYQCLLGELPFNGNGLGELILKICTGVMPVPSAAGQVPPGFDTWFARACAREPQERFQSARQLADSFRLLVTRGDGTAPEFSSDSIDATLAADMQTNDAVVKGSGLRRSGAGGRTAFVVVALLVVGLGVVGAVAVLGKRTTDVSAPTSTAVAAPPPQQHENPTAAAPPVDESPSPSAAPAASAHDAPSIEPAVSATASSTAAPAQIAKPRPSSPATKPAHPHPVTKPSTPGAAPPAHTDFGI